jgi:putative FmdB family regulatory protein
VIIYDYTCRGCGHEFKDVERIGGGEHLCPVCTGREIDKKQRNVRDPVAGVHGKDRKSPFR